MATNNAHPKDFVFHLFITTMVMAGVIALGAHMGPKIFKNPSKITTTSAAAPAVTDTNRR